MFDSYQELETTLRDFDEIYNPRITKTSLITEHHFYGEVQLALFQSHEFFRWGGSLGWKEWSGRRNKRKLKAQFYVLYREPIAPQVIEVVESAGWVEEPPSTVSIRHSRLAWRIYDKGILRLYLCGDPKVKSVVKIWLGQREWCSGHDARVVAESLRQAGDLLDLVNRMKNDEWGP